MRAWFQAYFLTMFIGEGVVDPYFSIQMIRSFKGYLGFVWLVRKWGLDNFFNRSR